MYIPYASNAVMGNACHAYKNIIWTKLIYAGHVLMITITAVLLVTSPNVPNARANMY